MAAPAQRRIIFQHIDEPGYSNDLACYVRNGGYEVLKKSVTRPPAELIDEVKNPVSVVAVAPVFRAV